MRILLGWATMSRAIAYDETQRESADSESDGAIEARNLYAPELVSYEKAVEASGGLEHVGMFDDLTHEILSVRVVVPSSSKTNLYQMSKRLPGSEHLPVSLAFSSHMRKSFSALVAEDVMAKGRSSSLQIVGMPGTTEFLRKIAWSCAAVGSPLPPGLWVKPNVLELPGEEEILALIRTCEGNASSDEDSMKYRQMVDNWGGPGVSGMRDATLVMAVSQKLGLLDG